MSLCRVPTEKYFQCLIVGYAEEFISSQEIVYGMYGLSLSDVSKNYMNNVSYTYNPR